MFKHQSPGDRLLRNCRPAQNWTRNGKNKSSQNNKPLERPHIALRSHDLWKTGEQLRCRWTYSIDQLRRREAQARYGPASMQPQLGSDVRRDQHRNTGATAVYTGRVDSEIARFKPEGHLDLA